MIDQTFVPAVYYSDARAALAWLEKAFGFEVSMLIEDDNGDVGHAEMTHGGRGRIMVGGEWAPWTRSPAPLDGANTQSVYVSLDEDVDAHCKRARAAGARIVAEPEDQFYGARTYRAVDADGHVWTFSQMIADVSREEAEKASGLKIQAKNWA